MAPCGLEAFTPLAPPCTGCYETSLLAPAPCLLRICSSAPRRYPVLRRYPGIREDASVVCDPDAGDQYVEEDYLALRPVFGDEKELRRVGEG